MIKNIISLYSDMNKLKTLFDVQTVTEVLAQQLLEPPKLKAGNTPIEIAVQIDEQGRTTAKMVILL